MLYHQKPEGFSPKLCVVGCFLEYQGKILLLHRHPHKPQGDTWGCPAGKVDPGESLEAAMSREIGEEIQYLPPGGSLKHLARFYVRYPQMDFTYDLFRAVLKEEPKITLKQDEHTEYAWCMPNDALRLNLIQDEDACIEYAYGSI